MSNYHLAQLNIGKLIAPLESAPIKEFVDNLAPINALAEASPGFIWRLQDDTGDATHLRPYGPDTLLNMSVWQDVESLREYVFRSAHTEFLARRKEWFEHADEPTMVLWWVPAGHLPSPEEAMERLDMLRNQGPTVQAFTFRQTFPAPE